MFQKAFSKTWILIIIAIIVIGGVLAYKYLLVQEKPIDKSPPFLLYMPSDKGPIDRVNQDIPPYLLYQSKSEEIPEQYLLADNEKLNTNLIFSQDSEFYCRPSNEKAQKIEYFYRNPGPGWEGGWCYRYALICGDNYWIVDGADWFGVKIYGPFENSAFQVVKIF